MDSRFKVKVISQTLNPNQVVYGALHQDYSEGFVCDEQESWPNESKCGELLVKRLLAGERGHFGPIEHVTIVFNCGYFPHSVMQQLRTHRLASFDVQSNRYTGQRIVMAAQDLKDIEDVFYLRPVGHYSDRDGKRYQYTEEMRVKDIRWCLEAARKYKGLIDQGVSEEHARGIIPFDVRQHFVVSFNARSLMHVLDLRSKADAQLECQQLSALMMPHFKTWMPELAEWYEKSRFGKARLSP